MVKIYQREIVGVYGRVSWLDISEEEYHHFKRWGENVRQLWEGEPGW